MKTPKTPAIRQIEQAGIEFQTHTYAYEERGGTATSARELDVPESSVIKTLVFKDSDNRPFVVLMTGDLQVSAKEMARILGVKGVKPCSPQEAQKHSGYQVGGTSPFGLKKKLPVYMEKAIEDLPLLYINGGKRGFLVSLTPVDLKRVIQPVIVEVGTA